jgi:lactobin A/cerein 7B family class IIb bacteriocin
MDRQEDSLDLQEVPLSELQEVEGGCLPVLVGVAVAAAIVLFSRDAW